MLSTTRSTLRNTDVLVVGGGIAGLSAAVFLAQQGVDCLLVERRSELSGHPRARGVHPRAMELMRAAGVEDELRGTPSARILAGNSGVVAARSLAGPELGVLDEKYVMDVGADLGSLSPTGWCLCHQGELEDVLRGRAERLGVALRFSTELVSFTQNGAGLTALVRDRATGAERTIEARYLVAADGARSGVRETLGVPFDGETLGHYLNIHFRADLTEPLAGRRFLMCHTANDELRGALMPLDNASDWLLHVAYDPRTEDPESFTEERCAALVRAATGVPGLRPRIRSVSPWDGAARTAGRFRDGRVFLVGDAAHVMPPSGGFGSSTGIQDAHNLAWKLAAVLDGWAGEPLLDSYDEERRPICRATVEQAALRSKDRPRLTGRTGERPPVHPGIVEDAQVWLSWRYRSSAVTPWDEGVLPGHGVWSAENDGRPGGRAPHLRLRRGGAELSVLDLFGDRPVLLTGPDNRAWQQAARAVAHELGLPLTVHGIGAELIDVDDRWPESYGVTAQGAVLVRPDGVVAWRCADAPIFAADTLRTVLVRLLARH
ncbi:FAD-dependent oxidoreductase [Streptomyces roseicoloratus]|uniref:FAD-dependent oxidoreductase n=1 Tax=Streptomyces roseicoloratus TaxID=2508722 RepID=UPI001C6844D7|nr:FAD-dependent monooxygenase [Streptomyces roseicoloratus]